MVQNLNRWFTTSVFVSHAIRTSEFSHGRYSIQAVNVGPLPRSDADQHKRDAKLDRNNRGAVEDLKKEEVLHMSVVPGFREECYRTCIPDTFSSALR
jgi:hypothetical protein